jgi:hypothetical protein
LTGRSPRSLRLALGAAFVLGFAASLVSSCELLVSLDGLSDGQCPGDEKLCYGGCVSKRNPMTSCGAQGTCAPCVLPNALATCTQITEQCTVAACVQPYKNCDVGDPGCSTDLAHDASNCGGCGVVCVNPMNGTPGCSDGKCAVGGCDSGFEDCDHRYENGCETNLMTNSEHCGSCLNACAAGQTCQLGVCG